MPAARLETFFPSVFCHISQMNMSTTYIYIYPDPRYADVCLCCLPYGVRASMHEYACGVSCHCGSYAVVYAHWVFLMKQRTSARNKSRCSCCMFFWGIFQMDGNLHCSCAGCVCMAASQELVRLYLARLCCRYIKFGKGKSKNIRSTIFGGVCVCVWVFGKRKMPRMEW